MSALLLLIRLQLGGWLRFVGDGLRTPRGAILAVLGLGVLGLWLFALMITPNAGGLGRESVSRYGPAMLVLYCVASVLFSPHDRSIHFAPAEVQFLFAGPFSRRQVLAYKVILTLLVSLPTALILGVAVRVRQGWLPAVATGLFLLTVFLQLFTLTLGLFGTWLGAAIHTRGRRVFAVALVLVAGIALYSLARQEGWDAPKLIQALLDSPAWQAAITPVEAFFQAMVASTWEDLWPAALVGLALNGLLLIALFLLDARFLEASAAASAHFYARLLRARGKQVEVEVQGGKERVRRFGLPMLPYMGGIGPVLWRQLTTAWRAPGRFALLALILGGVLATPFLIPTGKDEAELLPMFVGMGAWMSVFLPVLVPFDFRGDIDRMGMLKTLPISPWRLALAQSLTPALLMTLVHWSLLLGISFIAPAACPLLLGCALYAPVFNFYLIALDNLLFLFFPVRVQASTPGDFQAVGRNVLLSVGKLVGLIVPGLAVIGGVVLGFALGMPWLWPLVACPTTLLAAALIIPLSGLAFGWYDVGRNAPA